MAACDEVDVMTTANIENNITVSSNLDDVRNIVPKKGVPDYWSPSEYDKEPFVEVTLPTVNGLAPGDYEVMTIKIKAESFETVTVTITDLDDKIIFAVSLWSSNGFLAF